MNPGRTLFAPYQTGWRQATLTNVAAPALRQCAGVQHCDCSIHNGSAALGINCCVDEDEGLWGGSTVRRGGLGSAERSVACRLSSRPYCKRCCLQVGQAGAATLRGFTFDGDSDFQGAAS